MALNENPQGGNEGHLSDHGELAETHNELEIRRSELTVPGRHPIIVRDINANPYIQQDESEVLSVPRNIRHEIAEKWGLSLAGNRYWQYQPPLVAEYIDGEMWMRPDPSYNVTTINRAGNMMSDGIIAPNEFTVEIDFQIIDTPWSGVVLSGEEWRLLMAGNFLEVFLLSWGCGVRLAQPEGAADLGAGIALDDTILPANTTRTMWISADAQNVYAGIVGFSETITGAARTTGTFPDEYIHQAEGFGNSGLRMLFRSSGGSTSTPPMNVRMGIPRFYNYARFPPEYTGAPVSRPRTEEGPTVYADLSTPSANTAPRVGPQMDYYQTSGEVRSDAMSFFNDNAGFGSISFDPNLFVPTLDGTTVTDVDVTEFEALYSGIKSVPMNVTVFRNHESTGAHVLADGESWPYTFPAGHNPADGREPYHSPPDDYELYGDIVAAGLAKLVANGWNIFSVTLWYEPDDPNDGWWIGTKQELVDLYAVVMPKIRAEGISVGTTHVSGEDWSYSNEMLLRADADGWGPEYMTLAFIKNHGSVKDYSEADWLMNSFTSGTYPNLQSVKPIIVQNWWQYNENNDWLGVNGETYGFMTQESSVYQDLRAAAHVYTTSIEIAKKHGLAATAAFQMSNHVGEGLFGLSSLGGVFEAQLPLTSTPNYAMFDILSKHNGQIVGGDTNFPWLHAMVTLEDDGRFVLSYSTFRLFRQDEKKRFFVALDNLPANFMFKRYKANKSDGRLELVDSGNQDTFSSTIECEMVELGLIEFTPR